MKKRLRSEICSAYIEMGQKRLKVDAAVYELVWQRLADATLCGPHAMQQTPALSQAPEAPKRRHAAPRAKEPPAKRVRTAEPRWPIDSIVAEEPPS